MPIPPVEEEVPLGVIEDESDAVPVDVEVPVVEDVATEEGGREDEGTGEPELVVEDV